MKKIFKSTAVLLATIAACTMYSNKAEAQYDPMFSQYMYNEMFINPGYTGSRDFISAQLLHRSQWVGLDGAPKTQTFTIHAPIRKKKIGLGLGIMNETIGVTKTLSALGSFAYRLPVSNNATLAFGLQGGITSLQENLSDLTPVDGVSIDPMFMNDTPSRITPKAGFGMYYSKPKFYIGWSIPRLINSTLNPFNGYKVSNKVEPENWHNYITAGYVFTASHNLKLKPTIMTKAVHGAPVEFDFSLNALFSEIVWVGLAYRTGDAASVLTSINITPQFRVGYSYDYTLTEIRSHSSGSHEISLGYDLNFNKKGISSIRYF